MQLPASLRALFGGLAADLDDPEVREILISGPGRTFIARGQARTLSSEVFTDARIRTLADRLQRWIGSSEGRLGKDHHVQIIGATRGARPPIVNISRRVAPELTLQRMHERGGLDHGALSVLLGTAHSGCGLVIAGARGSGKTSLLAALIREWSKQRKVAVFDTQQGPLASAGLGHCVLDPALGIKEAVAVGADAIAVDGADAQLWRELLVLGRPFVATMEAPDAPTALARIVARVLAADAGASRTAAEAIAETSVDLMLELVRDKDFVRLRAIFEPTRERGTLIARPVLSDRKSNSGFVAIEAARSPSTPSNPGNASNASNAIGVLGHSPIPPAQTVPARATRMPRRKSGAAGDRPPSDGSGSGSGSFVTPPAVTPAFGTPVPPPAQLVSPSPTPTLDLPPSLPPPAITVPGTIDLEAPIAMQHDASPLIETSGEHAFDINELSEIRADHLVSNSFIYNIQSLGIPEDSPSQDVVLVDLPPEEGSLPLSFDGAEDHTDEPPISEARMVSPSMVTPLEEEVLATARAKSDLGEIQRARREAQERMPTVINTKPEPSANPAPSDPDTENPDPTIQPDEWALASEERHRALNIDATARENETGDLLNSSSSDIHASDLLTGSALPSQTDENPLAPSDLDATQSAMVSEMVSSKSNLFDHESEDLGAFRTLNPDADAQIFPNAPVIVPNEQETGALSHEKTGDLDAISVRSGFEEVTPYSPLLEKKKERGVATVPEISVNGHIDPNKAAVVSDKEFDAMIDELRDVTASSFGDQEEMTEDGRSDSGPVPVKRAKLAPDVKRQRRLR